MSTAIAKAEPGALAERVVIMGDLKELQPAQRAEYYKAVCDSIGLNPLTRPFEYITLNGKLTLYARKDATDQLRKLHGVSVQIVSRDQIGDVYAVTARATDGRGRTDESIGAVAIANLKGDALCNALMKAETKAKRRVTLSICGLGMLDETEMETIPQAARTSAPVEPLAAPTNGEMAEDLRSLDYDEPGLRIEHAAEVLQAAQVRDVKLEGAQSTPDAVEWPNVKKYNTVFAKLRALKWTHAQLANEIYTRFKLSVSDEPELALDALNNGQLKELDQALAGEFRRQ